MWCLLCLWWLWCGVVWMSGNDMMRNEEQTAPWARVRTSILKTLDTKLI